jgi:hypothetical protein
MKKIKQYVALGMLAGALFAASPTESRANDYINSQTTTEGPAMGSGNDSRGPQIGSGANTESRNPQLGSGARTESTGLFGSGSYTEVLSSFFSVVFS